MTTQQVRKKGTTGERVIRHAGVAFSEGAVKAASASRFPGVCGQFRREAEGENTGDISTWVQLWLSPVSFLLAPHWTDLEWKTIQASRGYTFREGTAKFARLVSASSPQSFVGATLLSLYHLDNNHWSLLVTTSSVICKWYEYFHSFNLVSYTATFPIWMPLGSYAECHQKLAC